jgi:hypothetical protein
VRAGDVGIEAGQDWAVDGVYAPGDKAECADVGRIEIFTGVRCMTKEDNQKLGKIFLGKPVLLTDPENQGAAFKSGYLLGSFTESDSSDDVHKEFTRRKIPCRIEADSTIIERQRIADFKEWKRGYYAGKIMSILEKESI